MTHRGMTPELKEQIAHDLGFIDSQALDNALVMQAETEKALRNQLAWDLHAYLNDMISDPHSEYDTNGYFIKGVHFAIDFLKGKR